MRLAILSILFFAGFCSLEARAQSDAPPTTVATDESVTNGLMRNEIFSVKPLAGVLAYPDTQGNNTGRLAIGVTWDMSLLSLINLGTPSPWYLGPAFGAIYSHLGAPSSDFFGSDPASGSAGAGANMLIFPTNLKVGYSFSDYYRIAIHGGANLIYRSIGNSVNLGEGSDSTNSLWKYYPDIGADLDIALARGLSISFRPDWTLAPNNSLFTGTLGIGVSLG